MNQLWDIFLNDPSSVNLEPIYTYCLERKYFSLTERIHTLVNPFFDQAYENVAINSSPIDEKMKILEAIPMGHLIPDKCLPFPHKIKSFSETPILSMVTFTITTCKRLELFIRTMNSFLWCCVDHHLISRWICIDDNSSEQDRKIMLEKYPFFEYVFKSSSEKGHADSMNKLLEMVQTPFVFHMEDDWEYRVKRPYISECLAVVTQNKEYGQCLINQNYSETLDRKIHGGFIHQVHCLCYYVHDHVPHGPNCSYWPHYSLRPGITKTVVFKTLGKYDPNANHFELEYARKYLTKGYKTTFLVGVNNVHIGRLTSERNDQGHTLNAYELNKVEQFVKAVDDNSIAFRQRYNVCVINLARRPDRWETFKTKYPFFDTNRRDAVDGKRLQSTVPLEQLFNPNDYNYRRGMIGCALSHLQCWIDCINSKRPMLVLEDDSTLCDNFMDKVDNLAKTVEYDVLFLGHHPRDQTESLNGGESIVEKWSSYQSLTRSLGGTGGYLITPKGAKKMLEFIQERGMTNGIDTMMQKACDDLDIYYAKPLLVTSECYRLDKDTVDTDIQRDYDNLRRDITVRTEAELEYWKGVDPNFIHVTGYIIGPHPHFSYIIGDSLGEYVTMYVSETVAKNNYRLKHKGEFTLKHIIKL